MPQGTGPAAQFYASKVNDREPYLIRARRIALLTIPYLYREVGANSTTDQPVPWQTFGALCVNNLTSKVKLSLFPPGIPFFEYGISPKTIRDLADFAPSERGDLLAAFDEQLSVVERDAAKHIETDGDGVVLTDAIRSMIVGGNIGLHQYPNATIRAISLENYVVVRDAAGNLIKWAICDLLGYDTLEPDMQALAEQGGYGQHQKQRKEDVKVYTYGERISPTRFRVFQEVCGFKVPDSEREYAEDDMPYHFPCWVRLKGEHYGRSYCEDYEGDLQSLDGYEQISTEAGMAAALFVRMVRPGGVTSKRAVEQAKNGDVITGDTNDVATIQSQKTQDLSYIDTRIQAIIQRLGRAFLMVTAVQRDAERVTREEVRGVAKELEEQLGGVYSNQVVQLQRPYIVRKLGRLQANGRLPRLPKDAVTLSILTGAAALGREQQLEPLNRYLQNVVAILGPQAIMQYHNPTNILKRLASGYGINAEGLVFDEQQLAAMQQQQQQAMTLQGVAPELVKQAGQYQTATAVAETRSQTELAKAQQQAGA